MYGDYEGKRVPYIPSEGPFEALYLAYHAHFGRNSPRNHREIEAMLKGPFSIDMMRPQG